MYLFLQITLFFVHTVKPVANIQQINVDLNHLPIMMKHPEAIIQVLTSQLQDTRK